MQRERNLDEMWRKKIKRGYKTGRIRNKKKEMLEG
jgi:hypothetical protein